MIARLTLYTQVTAEEGFGHIHVFDFHLDIVDLPIGLLCSSEFAPRAEERGGGVVRCLLGDC